MTFRKPRRSFRRTLLSLSVPLLGVLLLSPQLSYGLQTTVLVNFVDDSQNGANFVNAGNFAVADPGVDQNAPVNIVDGSNLADSYTGSNGAEFTIDFPGGTSDFTTTTGVYADLPILDSYLFNRSASNFDTVTVSSLEELSGEVTVVLYGVGDQPLQETEFQLTYNGVNLGSQQTIYDADLEDTYVTYTFTKVAGVNSLAVGFRTANTGGDNGAFNGFSITDAPSQDAIRINAGGPQHTDAAGNVFLADQFFGESSTFTTQDDVFIVGTGTNASNDSDVDDILYQSERFAEDLNYEIPVENGIYDVRLHFAEIFFPSENLRVFDVSIEGLEVLDNYDVFGTRFNAFTPGHDASIVEEFFAVEVVDGFLSLNLESIGADGVNNAKISAIEILPITSPTVVLLPTDGGTIVSEAGLTDTFAVALTQPPANDVTVQVAPSDQVSISTSTLTFTPANFDVPQVIAISAINDDDGEGQQSEPLQLTSASLDPVYDGITRTLNVIVLDDDLVPVEFDVRTITESVENPTSGAFGPDGRLYVCNQNGLISAFTFDNNYNITNTEVITTITELPDPGFTLGLAFNPFEEVAPGETATLYVTQSYLFRATPDFENNVLALSGPNHSVVTEVITGLPVSGFDHGINGLQFDGEGNLLIGVGGNTNTGVFDGVFGSDAPESPLTSAILRAPISDPNFNGNVVYEFIDPNDPELLALASGLGVQPDPNNQRFGEFVKVVDVPGELEVETFAVGLRNSYDLVFTTQGHIFATDNGPNGIAEDELNFVPEGAFLGHPSIPRGRLDPRQVLENAEYDADEPSTDELTSPLTALQSSTNGIDEYRSEVFGGQLRGQLIAQRFNNQVFFFELDETGTGLANLNSFGGGQIADGLDIVTGPGGVIFGIDRNQDRITIAQPVVNDVVASTAYDIFPFRAPSSGGNQFVIGGTNFVNIDDTTVMIGGVEAELISVESNRIVGVFPAVPVSSRLLDVTVISGEEVSVLEESFRSLGEPGLVGDINRDGVVDFLDISPFIVLLTTSGFQDEADINQDGVVNFLDISPFIGILSEN